MSIKSYNDIYTVYAWQDNNRTFTVTTNEGGIKHIRLILKDKQDTLDLSGDEVSVHYAATKPNGKEVLVTANKKDATNGTIEFPVESALTTNHGLVVGEVRVVTPLGVLKFHGINLNVHKGVSDKAAEQAEAFTALIDALRKLSAIQADGSVAVLDDIEEFDSGANGRLNPMASGVVYEILQRYVLNDTTIAGLKINKDIESSDLAKALHLDNYTPTDRTIAGLNLLKDISVEQLQTSLNLYPIIRDTDPPTSETKGETGQLYFDMENFNLYICIGHTGHTGYMWKLAFSQLSIKQNTRFNSKSKIYGVTFDDSSTDSAVTRIADAEGLQNDYVIGSEFQNDGINDFDNIFPWCDIRRCNLTIDGDGNKKIIYEGEEGFTTGRDNLFNPENVINANIDTTNKKIVSSPSCRLGYVKCEPNTIYTIVRNGELSTRFTYGYTTEFPVAETAVKNVFVKPTSPTLTYTTGDDARYLVFYFYIQKEEPIITPEEHAKNIIITKGTSELDTPVNVMVEIPKFYTLREKINGVETWAITGEPKSGFNIEPAFIDSNGKELDYIYVGAYEFSGTSSTKNHSVSGQEVATTLKMSNYRNIAKAVNMTCIDYAIIHALQFLWVVEFADRDTDKYMQGFSFAPWYSSGNSAITSISSDRKAVTIGYTGSRVKSLKAGQNVIICQNTTAKQTDLTITNLTVSEDEATAQITFDKAVANDLTEITDGTYYVAGKAQTTGRSDTISYHTGRVRSENALSPFRYRYMENLWGNTWAMLEGIRIKELGYYYTFDTNHYADTTIDEWKKSNFKAPNQPHLGDDGNNRAWISEMGFDINNRQIVLPTACSTDGATDKYYSSAFYSNYDADRQGNELDTTQEYICVYGGGYDHNALCGLFTMRFWWSIGVGEQQGLHSSRIVYRY